MRSFDKLSFDSVQSFAIDDYLRFCTTFSAQTSTISHAFSKIVIFRCPEASTQVWTPSTHLVKSIQHPIKSIEFWHLCEYSQDVSSELSPVTGATGVATIILKYLLGEWQSIASLVSKLFAYLVRERLTGLFEVLEYDSTLEILDTKGHKAIIHRRQRIRYLQDHIIAFQDHAWGDGNVLADYKVSPGVVVDKYQEGNRWNILISLRETRNKGDIEEFYIERTTQDSFTQSTEWYQTEVGAPTRKLKLVVIFPRKRPCKRAVLIQRSNGRTTEIHNSHQTLTDGRLVVSWEKSYPKRAEIYTIKWEW